MIQYFFFVSWEVSPGAGDNLVSAVMVVKIAELFLLCTEQKGNCNLKGSALPADPVK